MKQIRPHSIQQVCPETQPNSNMDREIAPILSALRQLAQIAYLFYQKKRHQFKNNIIDNQQDPAQ